MVTSVSYSSPASPPASPAVTPPAAAAVHRRDESAALYLREEEVARGVDLLFFVHSYFWRLASPILHENGMGRAHFRALYCIQRRPAITVGELMSLLGVRKQSLGRTLKMLKTQGLVAVQHGQQDRRQRQLFLTDKGTDLERRMSAILRETMSQAYRQAGQAPVTGFWHVCEILLAHAEHDYLPKRNII